MKVLNIRKTVASMLAAASLLVGGQRALAQQNHTVGDPGFELIGIGASGFYYFQGPPNSPFWEKTHRNDPDFPGSGIGNNWAYTSDYATNVSPNKVDPIGNQAVHGMFAYHHQILTDTFVSGRSYTLSVKVQGDANAAGTGTAANDRVWLYLFADSVPTLASGGLDNNALAWVNFNQEGTTTQFGPATVGPFTGFNRSAGSAWTTVNLSYTATAADDGKKIGLAMWGRNRAAFDDVALTSVVFLPGDYDRNGSVGQEDYQLWRKSFGNTISAGTGPDGNGNGTVDAADYALWRHYLPSGDGSGGGGVPEPGTFLLGMLTLGTAGLTGWRRKDRSH